MARAQDTVNTVCNNVINSLDCRIFDNKPICASNGVQYNTEYECSHARTQARTYTHARTRRLKGMGSNTGQRSCSSADWFQVVIILREVTASTKQSYCINQTRSYVPSVLHTDCTCLVLHQDRSGKTKLKRSDSLLS